MRNYIPEVFFLAVPVFLSAVVLSLPLVLGDPYPADWTRDTITVAYRYAVDKGTCCKAYFGAISRLGFMIWFSAAAIAFLTAVVHFLNGNKKDGTVFIVAVLLTGLLSADDAFMLHERRGLLSTSLYASYAVLLIVFFGAIYFSDLGLKDVFLFGSALLLLGASFLSDNFLDQTVNSVLFFEDALKLCGIFLWTTFFIVRCTRELARAN